ncbi:MAG: universal stress protein [Acetobacteraceae bacterium]
MPRYILVPATGTDGDGPVFATALTVARAWSGHLEFLHVRADIDRIIMSIATADAVGSGGAIAPVTEILERDIASREEKANAAVRTFCARQQIVLDETSGGDRVSAEYQVETGEEAGLVATHGRTADLLVVGRVRDDVVPATEVLEAALLRTGRPLLIASAKPLQVENGNVIIAWKDTREAARAVASALPFIQKAARVSILSVAEDTKSTTQSCSRLGHALRWHNRETSVRHLAADGRPPVETLLEGAGACGATLLVMGGYSHSRMREVVFGGFTRRVLRDARLPVLMAR